MMLATRTTTTKAPAKGSNVVTVYKNRLMRQLRFASRLKLAHVTFMGLTMPNLYHAHSLATISDQTALLALLGAIGSGGILIALTRFSQRVIGQLAVDTDKQEVRVWIKS
jgi:hypothetical protein